MTNQVCQADGPMRGADTDHSLLPSPYKEQKAKVVLLEARIKELEHQLEEMKQMLYWAAR